MRLIPLSLGWALTLALVVALVTRLSEWQARPFVSLLYLATAAALAAVASLRRPPAPPRAARALTWILALLLAGAHLSLHLGPVQAAVGWAQRWAWAFSVH